MKNAVLIVLIVLAAFCLCGCRGNREQSPASSAGDSGKEITAPQNPETADPAGAAAAEESGPVPTEEAVDSPVPEENPYRRKALSLLAEMSQEEKLCQLMIVSPDTLTDIRPTLEADHRAKTALTDYPVGGFSFGANNLQTRTQVISMLSGFQEMSKLGLFFCLDEEGGTVCRVMSNPALGTTRFDSMFDYRNQGTDTAFENASTIAGDIGALGFNLDFAPVADVWSNPENKVIGKRAYSDSFPQAAELVSAAVRGFHNGGVLCTLKHFPGHGSTITDSHKGLPYLTQTPEELEHAELLPFRAGIEAGADLVMVGHLMLPAIDPDYPASLSYRIVTGLLRQELGFEGLVITDALGMGALGGYTEPEKCILALNAGCDILLGVTDVPAALRGLTAALDDGTLSQQRVDESVLRILEVKLSSGILRLEEELP